MGQSALKRKEKPAPGSHEGRYCRISINPVSSVDDPRSFCPYPQIDRIYADSKVHHNGVGYCSLSEAAFGAILELLIPGFKIVEGVTFQVPIGEGRSVDFFINGALVEYHQPRLHPERGKIGDFQNRDDYMFFLRSLKRSGGNTWRKQKLIDETRNELASNYYHKRRELIDRNTELRNTELIVATSREDFYRKIILRFVAENPPSLGDFIARFWWWVNIIARQNGLPPLNKAREE